MNCPNCGREMIKMGFHVSKKGKYQRYRCMECGTTRTDFSINLRN